MRHSVRIVNWLASLLILFAVSTTLHAQLTEGSIAGTVTDASGAAVAGGNVKITNLQTGAVDDTKTDNIGYYRVLHLQIGAYQIRVEAQGFKATVLESIPVDVNTTTRADAKLQVGTTRETVEVTAGAALVQTEEGRLANTITNDEVANLPLNGRQVYQLVSQEPGVTETRAPVISNVPSPTASDTFDFGFIANGATPRGNNFLLDGTPNNNEWLGGTPLIYPSLDAVQEVQVQTLNFSAEYGRNNGAIVNIMTKAGTNKLHGTAFYAGRNTALNSRSFFDTVAKTPLQQNQFGVAFGGPIFKDKTFFFLNYEGSRLKDGVPAQFTVERGDYRQSFIEANPDTIAAQLFSDFPAPDCIFNLNDVQCVTVASQVERNRADQYLVRLDHHFTARDSVFLRWDSTLASGDVARQQLFGAGIRGFKAPFDGVFGSLGIGYSHQFSTNTLNDFRFAYGRNDSNISFGVPANTRTGQILKANGLPLSDFGYLFFDDGTVPIGGELYVPRNFVFDSFSFNDTLFHTVGRHSLKFGFQFEHIQENSNYRLFSAPFYEFLSIGSGFFGSFGSDSPYFTEATVSRDPNSPNFGNFTDTPRHFRWNRWAAFAQDDWKIRPRLTLNLGLRWDVFANPTEKDGVLSNIILGPGTTIAERIAGATVGRTSKLWNTNYRNFAPRIGLAWDPRGDGKTAIRSGFSIAYNEPYSNLYTNASRLNPPDAAIAIVNLFTPGQGTDVGYTFPFAASPDFAQPTLPNGGIQGTVISPNGVDANLRTAYSMQWFLGLQQELRRDWAIMLNYVGTRGVGGYTREDYNRFNGDICNLEACDFTNNRLNPGWSGITYISNQSSSTYHGMNASIRKRYSHGLSLSTNYTWGKVLDNVTEGGLGDYFNTNGYGLLYAGVSNIANQRADRGPSEFDATHRFTFSGLWSIPGPKGSGFLPKIAGGWNLNTLISLQSGRPFEVYCGQPWFNGCDFNMDGLPYDRPNRPAGIKTSGFSNRQFENGVFGDPTLTFFLDSRTSAAIQTFCPNGLVSILDAGGQCIPVGTNGNLSRNAFRGPAYKTVDVSLVKDTKLAERLNLQFRAEAFNLFNRVNLYNPNGDMSSQAFGKSSASFPARQIQLGLKILF